jgi:CAAX protease family protein
VAPLAILPAFVVSGAFSDSTSLRSYLSSLVRPKGKLVWYLIALFSFPVIHVVGNLITQVAGNDSSAASQTMTPELFGVAFLTFLRVFFFTGGINEETGWRGFVLPRLQAKYNPLLAGLVLWLLHMIWELPGDLLTPGSTWSVLSRLVLMPCWSILFMWVYNRTEGSILAPVLFHASMNSMNPLMGVLPVSIAVTMLLIGWTVFAVVYDRMWQKLPLDNPVVYQAVVAWPAAANTANNDAQQN